MVNNETFSWTLISRLSLRIFQEGLNWTNQKQRIGSWHLANKSWRAISTLCLTRLESTFYLFRQNVRIHLYDVCKLYRDVDHSSAWKRQGLSVDHFTLLMRPYITGRLPLLMFYFHINPFFLSPFWFLISNPPPPAPYPYSLFLSLYSQLLSGIWPGFLSATEG